MIEDDELSDLSAVKALGAERTVEQVLARELRAAIVTGRLRPGTRLRYRDVAKQFSVSVTPVRIALRELVQEGLIETRPHEGARVAPLSVEELEDVYAARIGYEGWLARKGAGALTDRDIATLERRLVAVQEAVEASDLDQYLRAAWAHRSTSYRAAGRPQVVDRIQMLYERSRRYNWLTLRAGGRLDESFAGIREYHDACKARDGNAARDAVRRALDRTMEHLVAQFEAERSSES